MKNCIFILVVSASVVGAVAAAVASASSARPSNAAHAIPPASSFSARVDNVWFPLKPGTRYVYTGVKDGIASRDVVTIAHGSKTIEGVRCVVVHDRLYLRGRLEERTTDWYSQDARGNVWYFGEDTAELDKNGRVTSTSGSWITGVDGARPGIYMPAHPRVGESGRQEFYKGQAEDHFRVVSLVSTATAARTKSVLLTQEWTPLEPGVLDHKMYVRGVGTVFEQTEKGGNERNELVSVTKGA